jgi:probable phosphoglycerate mutase
LSVLIPASLDATLVLVRHGESTYVAEGRFQGRADSPLSVLGARQAELVARRLAERDAETPLPIPGGPPIGIWHSPLQRAADTAAAIAAAQPGDVAPAAEPGLTEIAQGEWEGLHQTEVTSRWPAELAAWRRTPTLNYAPGGEPLADAAARVREALTGIMATLAAASPARDTLDSDILTRYSPVPGYAPPGDAAPPVEPWAILVAHDGIFRLVLMALLDVPIERFWSFPFSLCAISVVAFRNGTPSLRAHNLSEHLAPLAAEARAAAEARGDRRGAL